MQTFQMAIMLLFEDTDSMTCNDVEQALKLSQDVLLKHIASLIDCKLLLCDVPSEVISHCQSIHRVSGTRQYFCTPFLT